MAILVMEKPQTTDLLRSGDGKAWEDLVLEYQRPLSRYLYNMVRDEEWDLATDEDNAIRGALYYFVDAEDVIPDHIPGLGYLDDALYAEIVIRSLEAEIETYQEFCRYRSTEENRRRKEGLDPYVGREDWLADKRAVLHLRMRQRRSRRASGNGWGVRLF